ncbi:hypothetical protein BHM03_00058868 [Ensete ventricosum]|nr:hypothetical protein BHM03_00058868 [Ensete ventricosum]
MFHLTHANSAHASAVATKKHFRLHFFIVAFRAPCRSEPRATTPLCPYLPLAKGPITSPRGTHFRSNHNPGSLSQWPRAQSQVPGGPTSAPITNQVACGATCRCRAETESLHAKRLRPDDLSPYIPFVELR